MAIVEAPLNLLLYLKQVEGRCASDNLRSELSSLVLKFQVSWSDCLKSAAQVAHLISGGAGKNRRHLNRSKRKLMLSLLFSG